MNAVVHVISPNTCTQSDKNLLHFSAFKMFRSAIIFLIVLGGISCTVRGSLQINARREYPLMRYTKFISEEHFTPGLPVVIVLPLAEEDSTNEEVDCLIQELHTCGRWPIVVLNVSYGMNGDMYVETHLHGSYVILISGPCEELEEFSSRFRQQLSELCNGNVRRSWNPRGKFVVSVMSNCTRVDSTHISRVILSELWIYEIMNATVLFLKSNEEVGTDLQPNEADRAEGTHLELHTWHPYENSERCDPVDGAVPVKVFTARSVSDIKTSGIFKGYFGKNWHGCPIRVRARVLPPFVYYPTRVRYNRSFYYDIYEDGWDIELLKLSGLSLNMSLVIGDKNRLKYRNGTASIYIGGYDMKSFKISNLTDCTRTYYTMHTAWYSPCAVKYQRWGRFFKIFSVDLWITFAVCLLLAVITVSCISRYRHKSPSHEFKSYSNVLSIAANIIAVSLSVGVDRQPRTASLRVFFLSWVCYSVAISTVFQAYLTTYLIEPGYEEPIKSVDQMLKSDMRFGSVEVFKGLFTDSHEILKDFVICPSISTCMQWAIDYHNFSTIIHDFIKDVWRIGGVWTDESNRPLLCDLEDGGVAKLDVVFLVNKGSPALEYINEIIDRIVEAGIFMEMKNRLFHGAKVRRQVNSPTFADSYFDINIRHLQTAFHFLLLGYALSIGCFVLEIMWCRFTSKECVPPRPSLCPGRT